VCTVIATITKTMVDAMLESRDRFEDDVDDDNESIVVVIDDR